MNKLVRKLIALLTALAVTLTGAAPAFAQEIRYEKFYNRTATVQVASAKDGVLGTQSVVVGSPTGDSPVYPMFNVVVTKDDETGRFSVDLQ